MGLQTLDGNRAGTEYLCRLDRTWTQTDMQLCVCVSVCVFILFLWEERDKKTDANVIKERKSPTFMVPRQSSNYAQTRTQNRLVI